MVITYGFEMDVLPEANWGNLEEAQYVEYTKERVTKTIQIDLSYVNPEYKDGDEIQQDNDWIYITYLFNDDYYWFRYEYLSGGIASIDNALTATEAIGEYYPRLYIRLNQSDIVDWHKDAPDKKDTVAIFDKLNLDLTEITKQMHQSVGGEYGNVRGLYVFMGVQVNASKNQSALAEYCFNYFKKLYGLSGGKGLLQTIQDKQSSQVLSYHRITLLEHDGVISNEHRPLRKNEYCLHTKPNTHIFYHQITSDKYIALCVIGLNQTTYLSGYGFNKGGDDGELVIPIDRSIIKHLTNKERELLFHKSLHVAMIHVRVTKTKWYQRKGFKVLLSVIGVAIGIFTGGTGMPLIQLIKTATLSAIKAIAISYAVNALVSVAVKLGLNPKIAGVIAFVASISLAGMANGFDFSKVLTAPNIMKALNQSFNFYEKMLQVQYQDTLNQMKQLDNKMTNQNELLKEKQKLLDTKVFNPTQEMLRSNYTPTVNLFETPDMFYDRHYNYNVVAVSHGLITNFVQGSLKNKQPYQPKQQDIEDVLIIT